MYMPVINFVLFGTMHQTLVKYMYISGMATTAFTPENHVVLYTYKPINDR